MKTKVLLGSFLLLVGIGVAASRLTDIETTHLHGDQEVPAVSTLGNAEFNVKIFDETNGTEAGRTRIEYDLFYQNLQGSITQSHIHFGQQGVNGGISVWLCGNPPLTPPPGTQLCPPSPGVIRGTIRPADVVGPAGQGIAPGEFNELLRAIRAGVTYANVHTNLFPGGEIRGQLRLVPNGN